MDKDELKAFVNRLLDKKGFPTVKSFAKEFADGGKFDLLYLLTWCYILHSDFLKSFQHPF
jgi:hypothetical protein